MRGSFSEVNLLPRSIAGMGSAVILTVVLGACGHGGPARNPKLAQTHYLLGEDLFGKRQPEGAKRELLKAIELDPENREAHQLLGTIYFFEGMRNLDILERERCLKGIAAEEQRQVANKEFRRSEEYFRTAVKLAERENKIESDSLNYLANVALHFNRHDEAIALARKALDNILYTQRQVALGSLGWAYFLKGDRVGAARELRQAIFHEPKFCLGRYRLAKVYYENKAYDTAIEELKNVTEDKSCPIQEAFQLLGLAYMKQRDPAQARVQFEKCNELNPKSCVSEECRRYAKLM